MIRRLGIAAGTLSMIGFETRRAQPPDVDAIAVAHRDSIRSLGAAFYPPDIVEAWQEGLEAKLYLEAMKTGEVFFVATGQVDRVNVVLGFSSDYSIAGTVHGVSVYVRGAAARRGVGAALLALAEAHARDRGATRIEIESSLAGVDFYRANGFQEHGRGITRLRSGKAIACVLMYKDL
jgi:putative acetyltransferase